MKLVIRKTSWQSMVTSALEYIWAAIVILEGNSVYQHLADRNLHLTFICLLVSALLLLIKIRGHISSRGLFTGAFLFAYMLAYFLIQQQNISDELFICMMLLGLPILVMLFDIYVREEQPYRLFTYISNLIFILTILSLTVWLFGSVLHVIPKTSSVRVTWGGVRTISGYLGLQYDVAKDTTYGIRDFYRNQSLFTEAPMFNLWLCIALATEVFLKKRASKVRVVVFLIGIFSTVSTTGLLFCVLLFGLKYFEVIARGSSVRTVILIFLLVLLLPLGLAFIDSVYRYKSTTLSFAWRLNDYISGFRRFMEHPLIGTGYGSLLGISSSTGSVIGYSNSITALLGTGGLWITAVFLLSLWGYMAFRGRRHDKATVKFGICYLYLFILTIFFARYLAAVFYAFGLALLMNRDWARVGSRSRRPALNRARMTRAGGELRL